MKGTVSPHPDHPEGPTVEELATNDIKSMLEALTKEVATIWSALQTKVSTSTNVVDPVAPAAQNVVLTTFKQDVTSLPDCTQCSSSLLDNLGSLQDITSFGSLEFYFEYSNLS